MNPAGHLQIRLQAGDPEHSVAMTSTRPRFLHRLFRGKPLQEALQTIPLLFNICRRAQALAAIRAAEQALQLATPDSIESSRADLLRLEMLHEHLWSLLLDLPPLLDLTARQEEMAAASQQLNTLMNRLDQDKCLTRLSATPPATYSVQMQLDAALLAEIRGLLFGNREGPGNNLAALRAGDGLAGAMVRFLEVLDWEVSWQPLFLPAMDCTALQTLLSADSADQYIHGQLSASSAVETGALPRTYYHPLVEECRGQHGNGLTTRLVALLVETDQLLGGMPAVQIQLQCLAPSLGTGLCHLETARGRLIHAVSLVDDSSQQPLVKDIRVVAPTDWNFHSEGAAAQLLGQLLSAKSDRLKDRAELLIKLLNPCVAYQLAVANGASAEVACHA